MTQPTLAALDHLVLTVADIPATCAFYRDVLGMMPEAFHPADGSTRWALKFGAQKINLHQSGAEFEGGTGPTRQRRSVLPQRDTARGVATPFRGT